MDSRTAPTPRAATVGARLIATAAVLFAAVVLFAPAAARGAGSTSAHRAGDHHASAITVPVADKQGGTLRVDLPQLPSPAPPATHLALAALHTADASSIALLTTADSQRTRGPPPDDRS
jgi:hypothetical protein